MRKIWKHIHSPRNLIIFDAAARLGSFTSAANELGIQQPSVSSAIKQLEDALGVKLFVRGHRRLQLTTVGKHVYSDVSKALTTIETSLDAVREIGKDERVTLSCTTAFATNWLIPKLGDLHAKHPDIDLQVQISARELDLDKQNINLGIRLGDGKWSDVNSVKIADEVIFPVASPKVMSAATNLRSIPDLKQESLVHLETRVLERPSWSDWFAHHGVTDREITSGLRFNDYIAVLQAVISGEGYALGWEHLVRNLIDSKLLIGREDWTWKTGKGVYLVWSNARPLKKHAAMVRDWMVSVSDSPKTPTPHETLDEAKAPVADF